MKNRRNNRKPPYTPTTLISKQIVIHPKNEQCSLISKYDWEDLKSDIDKIKPLDRLWGSFFSICVGVFPTALISVIEMCNREEVATWYQITIWCFLVISLVLGIVFLFQDKKNKGESTKSAKEVLDKMKRIEGKSATGTQNII